MISGIGVDLVDKARFINLVKKFGNRVATKILSKDEYLEYKDISNKPSFLSKRFAAKEALSKALGVGLNDADICAKFANEGDFDCMLLAGRYTLIDQSALDEFFPIAKKNNIGIILGGVFNSGILAKGIGENVTYWYDKIPPEIKEKYNSISPFFSFSYKW